MAVATTELVSPVSGARPEHRAATLMAGEAHGVLRCHRSAPLLREAHDAPAVRRVFRIFPVVGAGAVTCFATLLLRFFFRIQTKRIRVPGVDELLALRRMARDAHRLADIGRALVEWGRR